MGAKVVSARLRHARMWRPMLAALMAVSCNARCYLDEDPTNPGASLVSVPPFEFGPEVVSLTEDQFENVMQISTGELWVVYFFAPWCSHCAAFKPVFECLPSKLQLPNQKLKFSAGAINCEKFQELCDEMDINYYPMVKSFFNPDAESDTIVKRFPATRSDGNARLVVQELVNWTLEELNKHMPVNQGFDLNDLTLPPIRLDML